MSDIFAEPKPIHLFQAGGDHEEIRSRGWPHGLTRIPVGWSDPAGGYVVGNFEADWRYYHVIGLSFDEAGKVLPNLALKWHFQGIVQEATRPELVHLFIDDDKALNDLHSKGWHIYKRYFSNTYYRRASDHPDPDAPPYPNGAEINPDKPVEMSATAKQYLVELLKK
jgi:hypothetical protein